MALTEAEELELLELEEQEAMLGQPQPQQAQPASRDITFLNRGIAGMLGAPVDLAATGMDALAGLAGFDPRFSQDPIGGRQWFERGFNVIPQALGDFGIGSGAPITPREGEETQTLGANIMRGTGEALTGGMMAGGAMAIARGGSGALSRLSDRALSSLSQNLPSVTALEALSGAGAGAGGYMADQVTDNPLARVAAEMVGGIATPMAAASAVRAPAMAARAARGAVTPFTEGGATIRAQDRLQSLVADPEATLTALRQDTIADLSPAQRAGDEGLLQLEQRAAQAPDAAMARREQIGTARERLTTELMGEGSAEAARTAVRDRAISVSDKARQQIRETQDRVKSALSTLEPTQRGSQASTVVRAELEDAYGRALAREAEVWSEVPNAGITTGSLKKKYREFAKTIPKAQQADIPAEARRLLAGRGGFATAENIQEFQGLRSRLLEESREARASGQRNKARISETIADLVLDEMGATAGNTKGVVGEKIRAAMDESRALNETFRTGALRRILMPDKQGGDVVDASLTLEKIIGAGNVSGAVNMRSLLNAADTPKTREAARDYILERMNNAAVRDGRLNTTAAENFVRDNADILDNFPDIRKEVADAIKAERDLMRAEGRMDRINSVLNNKQRGALARYIDNPEREIETILSSKNPAQSAKMIKNAVKSDPEALQGLQASVSEYLIRQAKTGRVDDFGNEVISGAKIQKMLRDSRNKRALTELAGADGVSRIEKIAGEFAKLERAETAKAADRMISDAPNMMVGAIATTLGARAGAKLGAGTSGASLKTASFMSARANDIMSRLTGDRAEALLIRAMNDKDLFEALMTGTRTTAGQKKAAERLNTWMLGPGARILQEQDEQETQ